MDPVADKRKSRMRRIVSFRPGVASNNTAFECQALIYKYLQAKYNYSFAIVKSVHDVYEDSSFEILSIPESIWKPIPRTHLFLPSISRSRVISSAFCHADGVLTLDPINEPQGLVGIRAARKTAKPVWIDSSVTLIGAEATPRFKLFRQIVKDALCQVNGIVVTAPKCIERFQSIGLFDSTVAPKFYVMGHPVDTNVFRPAAKQSGLDGKVRILVVARLVPEKGLYYVLETVHHLVTRYDNILLQLLGAGPMEPLLRKEIHLRGLESHVEILKPVSRESLPEIMSGADIYVSHPLATTNWEEFFGAANLEAMACGLPCVLSRNGAITYSVRQSNAAIFVDERGIGQMLDVLVRLIEDEQERSRLGSVARRYVQEHYDISIIAEKFRRMLEEAFVI